MMPPITGGTEMALSVRSAIPDDVKYVPGLEDMASKANARISAYEVMFPGTVEQRLEKIGWLFLNGKRVWSHYSHYQIAEWDGRVAGMLCTFHKDLDKTWLWRKTLREMGYNNPQLLALVWRMLPCLRVDPARPKDTLIVGSAATLPEFRRRGVITALLESAIDQGRKENYPRMQISVYIGNDAAQGAYEKVGFKVTDEYTNRAFMKRFGPPGARRLIIDLD